MTIVLCGRIGLVRHHVLCSETSSGFCFFNLPLIFREELILNLRERERGRERERARERERERELVSERETERWRESVCVCE